MRRLIFHLGLPRTGTTSIQAFLADNRDALLARGILYPAPSGATPRHRNFERAALNPAAATAVNHVALAMELLDTSRNLTERAGPLPEWSAVLDRMAADALDTLIVSYENFGLTPRKYDFSRLDERLAGYERSGILYLRHPGDWLISLYEQHIRGKRRGTDTFADFGQFERADGITTARRVRMTKRQFGLRSLTPIDFGAAARDDGLIPSFLDAAGLADQVVPAGQTHRNAALPGWQTLFLRECNRRDVADVAFVWIRQAFSNANRLALTFVDLAPGLDTLTPQERAELTRVASADIAELRDKTGMVLTGPKAAPPGPYRPFADADFRAVIDALRTGRDLRPPISPEVSAELARVAG